MGTVRTRRWYRRLPAVLVASLLGVVLVPSTASAAVWAQQQKLTASDAAPGDQFGLPALSTDGNTALIGAPGQKDVAAGAAYVFTRSGGAWTQQAKLTA